MANLASIILGQFNYVRRIFHAFTVPTLTDHNYYGSQVN